MRILVLESEYGNTYIDFSNPDKAWMEAFNLRQRRRLYDGINSDADRPGDLVLSDVLEKSTDPDRIAERRRRIKAHAEEVEAWKSQRCNYTLAYVMESSEAAKGLLMARRDYEYEGWRVAEVIVP